MTGFKDDTTPSQLPTAYEILGLPSNCNQDEIQPAYQKLARHLLSTSATDTEQGQHIMSLLDYHYGLINTPARRYAYDTLLQNDHSRIRDDLERLKVLEGKYERLQFKYSQEKEKMRLRQNMPAAIPVLNSMFTGFFRAAFGVIGLVLLVILLIVIF